MSSEFLIDEHSFNVSAAVDMFVRHMTSKEELDDYNLGKLTQSLMSDTTDQQNVDKLGRLRQLMLLLLFKIS